MKMLVENGMWSGVLGTQDEINKVRLLKSHMPIMGKANGPEPFLCKAMIGMTYRLEGVIWNLL